MKDSGHHRAAEAIQSACKLLYPQVETKTLSATSSSYPRLGKVATQMYLQILKTTPTLWGYFYNNPELKNGIAEINEMLQRINAKKFLAVLNDYAPDVVVCTQAFPCSVVARGKIEGGFPLPLVGIITDYVAHIYWPEQGVDKYIVPTPEVKTDLQNRGIEQQKIKTLGIPIDPVFQTALPKSEARVRLKLNPGLKTFLIMGGSQGLGPTRRIIKKLDKLQVPFQIIVITGTNKTLYRQLKTTVTKLHFPARIFSFTRRVDKIMDAADFIITKPGGITTAEAMAKGLPIIIVNPLPGQEEYNTNYLTKIGVARKVDKLNQILPLIRELLLDEKQIELMSCRCRQLARPFAAQQIAREVISLA